MATGSTLFIEKDKVSHKPIGSSAVTTFEGSQLSKSKS